MSSRTRKLAVFSLALNVGFVLFFAGKRIYYTNSGVVSSPRITQKDIVFVGNSLTERFPLSTYWKANVINEGISGNTMAQILERIGAIAKNHPRRILLEGGINDIHFKVPVDSIVLNYKCIIDSIHIYSPETAIILQSVFPVTLQYSRFQFKVMELNNRLTELAKSENVPFIDIFTPLGGRTGLDTSLTIDGIHLNPKGYEIWKKTINPLVE